MQAYVLLYSRRFIYKLFLMMMMYQVISQLVAYAFYTMTHGWSA